MKKMVLVTAVLLSLFIIIMKSDADMKITPSGVTSPDGSGVLRLNGSATYLFGGPSAALISGVNTYSGDSTTYGGYFESAGTNGRGVYGYATGSDGMGVYGSATATTGRGVYGEASGNAGTGVYGEASGSFGRGVTGGASGSTAEGVYGSATGSNGMGVSGAAFGTNGRGVSGYADGTSGRGVSGHANGTSGMGVYGKAGNTGGVTNYGGYFEAAGTSGRGVYGYASGGNGTGVYGSGEYKGVYGEASLWTGTGVHGYAAGTSGSGVYGEAVGSFSKGVYGSGTEYDFYAGGPGTNYGAFTGAHEVKFAEDTPGEIVPGMIVSVTGKTETRKDKNGEISLSSTLPTVTLSTKAGDKAVFGVIVSEGPLPQDHWYETQEGERFGVVNALGEGRVWVTDFNGDIQAGDYITTSVVQGYGQLQNDDLLHSYTLGKAIETIDWEQVTETVQHEGKTYKRHLIAVVYTSG